MCPWIETERPIYNVFISVCGRALSTDIIGVTIILASEAHEAGWDKQAEERNWTEPVDLNQAGDPE